MTILEKIFNSIVEGKVEDTAACVEEGLKAGIDVDEILKKGLLAAMDLVGVKFGDGEFFIPQVVWSAKAMQAGMNFLKPHFTESHQTDRARIIIGTAEGDIHDIGKKLVAMMLEGAGFEVIDLGVDVKPETFIDKAAETNADIIAISALLTTTMTSMADVVALRNERALSTAKIIIGGAPLSLEYCREIGADGYGVDAGEAVTIVKELLGL
jgi:5-methyltetrahydrofolate--homocysteine methyltransferase